MSGDVPASRTDVEANLNAARRSDIEGNHIHMLYRTSLLKNPIRVCFRFSVTVQSKVQRMTVGSSWPVFWRVAFVRFVERVWIRVGRAYPTLVLARFPLNGISAVRISRKKVNMNERMLA